MTELPQLLLLPLQLPCEEGEGVEDRNDDDVVYDEVDDVVVPDADGGSACVDMYVDDGDDETGDNG